MLNLTRFFMTENCGFEFECPLMWDKLKANPADNNERFCDKCQKTVYRGNNHIIVTLKRKKKRVLIL